MHKENEPVTKSCLVTGGNGYLGTHVVKHLTNIGWNVKTLGTNINNSYSVDLSAGDVSFNEPLEIIIHCAGKAHSFPKTAKEEQEFFDVNVKGTQNLLNALEKAPSLPKTFVFMSSVIRVRIKRRSFHNGRSTTRFQSTLWHE